MVMKMDSLGSFPQDAGREKLATVNYCPRCGSKIEKGRYCLNCGRDLTQPVGLSANTVHTPVQSLLKRPTGITILCILWFFGGLINLFGGLGGLGDDLYALSVLDSLPSTVRLWASWAVPMETLLVTATVIMGLLQFATIYGLWNRKRWSRKSGIGLTMGLVAVNWIETFLLMTAPASLRIQPDFAIVVIGTVMAVVYVSYLKAAHVKKYLGGD